MYKHYKTIIQIEVIILVHTEMNHFCQKIHCENHLHSQTKSTEATEQLARKRKKLIKCVSQQKLHDTRNEAYEEEKWNNTNTTYTDTNNFTITNNEIRYKMVR